MKRNLAIAASIIFHPMLMPLIGLFLIFHSGTHISYIPSTFRVIVYWIVFATTCLLPLSMLPLFLYFGVIKSFNMEHHRERVLPVFTTGVLLFIGYLVLQRLHLPLFLNRFLLASIFSLITASVITYFWKISLHMVGIGGVLGAILILSLKIGLGITPAFILLIIGAGITASARLYLNAHTSLQILAGFALGFMMLLTISL